MRWGVAVSLVAQTGQSEAIHSPDECARTVVRVIMPAAWSTAVVWTVAISCWLRVLRTISKPLESGASRNERSPTPPRTSVRMVASRDFSGLVSSAWALARGAAIVPIFSLDRCMALLLDAQEIKADSSRFRAFGPNAVADRLLRILRHQAFELGFGALMLEMRLPGASEDIGEFDPGVGGAHINDAHRLNTRSWRINPEESRGLTRFDATPELAFSRDDEVLVEWIRVGGDFHPFAPPGNNGQNRRAGCDHPHVVLELRHVFRQRGFFRERPRKHELGLEYGLTALHSPIEGGAHPAQDG